MSLTVFKTKVIKENPKEIIYRSYRNFKSEKFRHDLKKELRIIENPVSYEEFESS